MVITENDEIFKKLSQINVITNLTIGHRIELSKIQLVIELFPRLEYLTFGISTKQQELESITRFILWNSIINIRPLSSLCITKQYQTSFERLRTLIETEQLLRDYKIRIIKNKIYLWW